MDKLVPLLLLFLGVGGLYLGIAGLVRLSRKKIDVWVLGLGVRTRLGALKVLVVALALFFLAYSSYRSGSLMRMLQSSVSLDQEINLNLSLQLKRAEEALTSYRGQIVAMSQEMQECQSAAARLGTGLANKNDIAGELKSILAIRKKEISGFESSLGKLRDDVNKLQQERDQMSQSYRQTLDKVDQLQSQVSTLQTTNTGLETRLSQVSGQNEVELKRLQEEIGRLKGLTRDAERRSNLLRQGLSLKEANDWQLEQEIQRLANLLARQPDVNNPSQSEISRALQRINQILREGAALTKQARSADNHSGQQSQNRPSESGKK